MATYVTVLSITARKCIHTHTHTHVCACVCTRVHARVYMLVCDFVEQSGALTCSETVT